MNASPCYSALRCLVKFDLVGNKRIADNAISSQEFFIIHYEGKSHLRGAICGIWEPNRKLSPRFTDLWHSKWEERREATVLLEVGRITKVATLQVSPNYDPELARKLGLHPSDMYFASCIARTNY